MSTPNSSEQRTCPRASTGMHYTNHQTTEVALSQYLELVIRNYHSLQDMGFSHLTMTEAESFLFDDTTDPFITKTKRTRPTSSRDEPAIPHPRKKQRRQRGKTSHNQTDSLPSTIHPNLQGIITITPPSLWESLHPEHKTWVLRYNAAVRRVEKLPSPPKGTHISHPINDGDGNKGIPGSRHSSTLDIGFTADNHYTLTVFEPN